jgi:hypothetical protein
MDDHAMSDNDLSTAFDAIMEDSHADSDEFLDQAYENIMSGRGRGKGKPPRKRRRLHIALPRAEGADMTIPQHEAVPCKS